MATFDVSGLTDEQRPTGLLAASLQHASTRLYALLVEDPAALIENWKKRCPPPTTRVSRPRLPPAACEADEDSQTEESES